MFFLHQKPLTSMHIPKSHQIIGQTNPPVAIWESTATNKRSLLADPKIWAPNKTQSRTRPSEKRTYESARQIRHHGLAKSRSGGVGTKRDDGLEESRCCVPQRGTASWLPRPWAQQQPRSFYSGGCESEGEIRAIGRGGGGAGLGSPAVAHRRQEHAVSPPLKQSNGWQHIGSISLI